MIKYIKDSLNKLQYSKISCPQDLPYLWQAPVFGQSNTNLHPQTTHQQYRPNKKQKYKWLVCFYKVFRNQKHNDCVNKYLAQKKR